MCLWTKQIKPLIAEEPIIAYKVLINTIDNKFISPYQEYDYTKHINSNEVIKDVIPKAINPNVCEVLEDIMNLKKVYKGIHLFTKIEAGFYFAKCFRSSVIFKCEIPINSYYFMNDSRTEICTNQFRFIEKL